MFQVVCVPPREGVQSDDMWRRRDFRLGSVGSPGHEGVPGLLLSALRRPSSRDRCVREGGGGGEGLFNIFTSSLVARCMQGVKLDDTVG